MYSFECQQTHEKGTKNISRVLSAFGRLSKCSWDYEGNANDKSQPLIDLADLTKTVDLDKMDAGKTLDHSLTELQEDEKIKVVSVAKPQENEHNITQKSKDVTRTTGSLPKINVDNSLATLPKSFEMTNKIIDFKVLNSKNLSSNFCINLNGLMDIYSDVRDAEWSDTSDVSLSLKRYTEMGVVTQLEDKSKKSKDVTRTTGSLPKINVYNSPATLPKSFEMTNKIIDFTVLNSKNLSSNFCINLNGLMDIYSDVRDAEWSDTSDVSLSFKKDTEMGVVTQLEDKYTLFDLLASPTSELLTFRTLFDEIGPYHIHQLENKKLIEEEDGSASELEQEAVSSTTRVEQLKEVTYAELEKDLSEMSLQWDRKTILNTIPKCKIVISQSEPNGLNQNTMDEFRHESPKEAHKNNEKQTNHCPPENHMDYLECHSIDKIQDGGYIINEAVCLARRNWHCVTGTKMNLHCEACQQYFAKPHLSLHLTTKKHEINLLKFRPLRVFDLSLVRKFSEDRYHCAICNTLFSQANSQAHVETAEHKTKLQEAKKDALVKLQYKKTIKDPDMVKLHYAKLSTSPQLESLLDIKLPSPHMVTLEGTKPIASRNIVKQQDKKPIASTKAAVLSGKADTNHFLRVQNLIKVSCGGFILNRTVEIGLRNWNACTRTPPTHHCNICQESYMLKNPIVHYSDKKHKENLKKCFFLNKYGMNLIRKLPTDAYHCGVCGVVCTDAMAHTLTGTHCSNMEAATERASEILGTPARCLPAKF